MANYVSKPADYGNYTQPINLDLVNFVMQSKQQKYDYNLAKLESKISDELGAIDLARTEDKKYFLDRANRILGSAGDISQIDFSNNNNARALDNRINTIVDDRVLNDVVSTSNYRAFQNTLQQKQKDGEGYDAKNAAYAMEKQGANAWLKGESDSLGAISYEDYTDVGAELKDISENLDKYANVVKYNTPEGLYFKNVEGKYLTSEEIRGIAEQQLSDKAKRQMQINGWANYDGGNTQAQAKLTEDFKGYSELRLKEIDSVIGQKELRLKSLGDAESTEKDLLIAEIEQYKENKRVTSDYFNDWIQKGNYDSMSSTLEKDRVLSSFSNTFAFDNRGTTYSTNQAALALQKLQMQAALKKQSGVGGIEGASTIDMFAKTTDRDAYTEAVTQANKWEKSFNQEVMNEFNKLDVSEQESFMQGYDKQSGMTKQEYIFEKLDELPGNRVVNDITMSRIEELKLKKESYEEAHKQAVTKGFEAAESTSVPGMVTQFYDNPNIQMSDENGNVVSVRDYLESKGIGSGDGIKLNSPEFKEVKDQILKSYYADKILSSSGLSAESKMNLGSFFLGAGAASPGGGLSQALGLSLIGSSVEIGEEDAMMMNRLIELTGSKEEAEKFINKSKDEGLYDTNNWVDRFTDAAGIPTVGISSAFNRDNSVTDDGQLNSWITLDKIKTEGGKFINAEKLRPGKRQQALSIPLSTDMGAQIAGIVSSGVATVTGEVSQINIAKGSGNIAIYETGPDTVRISGRHKVKGIWQPYEVEILKSTLPEGFQQAVTFETDRAIFDRTNMKAMEGNVNFATTDDRRAFLDATYFTGSKEMALGITKDGLVSNLYNYYPSVMGSATQPSLYAEAITNMLESNNVFTKIEKDDDGEFYLKVVSRDLTKGPNSDIALYSELEPIPESMYDEAYRRVKRVPQIYVAQAIEGAIRQAQNNPQNPSNTLKKILSIYGGK